MDRRNFLSYAAVLGASALASGLAGCRNDKVDSDNAEYDKAELDIDERQSQLELELAETHVAKAWVELYDPNGNHQKVIQEYEAAAGLLDKSNPMHRDELFRVYRYMRDVYNRTGDTEKSKEMSEKLKRL